MNIPGIIFLVLLFCNNVHAQCTAGFLSVTSTGSSQTTNGINISIASPTNAQTTRATFGLINGYFIGDENSTEQITFAFSKPVAQIKITGRALSAVDRYNNIEYFTLQVNGMHHVILPTELITPDPVYGRECFLEADGAVRGDTIPNGDGSFVFTFAAPAGSAGISNFVIKDSVAGAEPEGAIFDVQFLADCNIAASKNKLFFPNAFTPNGDGQNDIFKPIVLGNLVQYDFFVYNRWGQTVFHSDDAARGWDGFFSGRRQAGVFAWRGSFRFAGEFVRVIRGTVVLIN